MPYSILPILTLEFTLKVYKNISEFPGAPNVVLTTGTFDGVHLGHQKIIEQLVSLAKETQGESVVLTFDPHPRHVIFPDNDDLKLLHNWEEKSEELKLLGVDHLIVHPFSMDFSRITATDYIRDLLINKLKAKHIIVGYDHQFGRNREGNFEFLKEGELTYGYQVVEIPALDIEAVNISSTKIRLALENGEVEKAETYLSRPYSLQGTVIEGNAVGRGMGFPTANLDLTFKYKLIPKNGVYAVEVKNLQNNLSYNGVMNIGFRPTLEDPIPKLHLEVHIFNFSETIYGSDLRVYFKHFIREEQKFDTLDNLKDQIKKDVEKAQNLLLL